MQNNKFESCYMAEEDEQKYDKLMTNDQGEKGMYTNLNRTDSFSDEYGYKDYPNWLGNYPGGERLKQKVILKKSTVMPNDKYYENNYPMWLGNYPGGDNLTQKIKIDGKVGREELYWGEEIYPYLMWLNDKKGKSNKIEPYSGLNYDNQRGIRTDYLRLRPDFDNEYSDGKKIINYIDKREKNYYDEYGIYTDLSDFDETYDGVYDLR